MKEATTGLSKSLLDASKRVLGNREEYESISQWTLLMCTIEDLVSNILTSLYLSFNIINFLFSTSKQTKNCSKLCCRVGFALHILTISNRTWRLIWRAYPPRGIINGMILLKDVGLRSNVGTQARTTPYHRTSFLCQKDNKGHEIYYGTK